MEIEIEEGVKTRDKNTQANKKKTRLTVEELLRQLEGNKGKRPAIGVFEPPNCEAKTLTQVKIHLLKEKEEYDGARRCGLYADYKFGWSIKYARDLYQSVRKRSKGTRIYQFYDWLKKQMWNWIW